MARFSKPRIGAKLSPLLRRKVTTKTVEDFGVAGKPVDTTHPFYFGFMATAGALIALTVLKALASASQVFVLIVISLFFAIGLKLLAGGVGGVTGVAGSGNATTSGVRGVFIGWIDSFPVDQNIVINSRFSSLRFSMTWPFYYYFLCFSMIFFVFLQCYFLCICIFSH